MLFLLTLKLVEAVRDCVRAFTELESRFKTFFPYDSDWLTQTKVA